MTDILELLDIMSDHVSKLEAVKQAAIDFLNLAKKSNKDLSFLNNDKVTININEETVLSLTNLHDLAFELHQD